MAECSCELTDSGSKTKDLQERRGTGGVRGPAIRIGAYIYHNTEKERLDDQERLKIELCGQEQHSKKKGDIRRPSTRSRMGPWSEM